MEFEPSFALCRLHSLQDLVLKLELATNGRKITKRLDWVFLTRTDPFTGKFHLLKLERYKVGQQSVLGISNTYRPLHG